MEWAILFLGPVGAGKTCAIQTLSDIDTASTEVEATDATALMKQFTTVSMDDIDASLQGMYEVTTGDLAKQFAPGAARDDLDPDTGTIQRVKKLGRRVDWFRARRTITISNGDRASTSYAANSVLSHSWREISAGSGGTPSASPLSMSSLWANSWITTL